MDGILVVDKPQGLTSHDVVDLIRKKFNLKKVGHAGTPDPMATGVLVLLIGKYTKSSDLFMAGDKDYEATLVLGATSDTADAWGKVKPSGNCADLSSGEIEEAFKNFLGEIDQCPPMYSAVKVNGRKLYELARKGISVKVKPRKVTIKKLEITDISLPQVSFNVTCSKGTYVRQLCVDIGETLKCGAHLSRLKRTRVGDFSIDEAFTVEELKGFTNGDLEKRLLSR